MSLGSQNASLNKLFIFAQSATAVFLLLRRLEGLQDGDGTLPSIDVACATTEAQESQAAGI